MLDGRASTQGTDAENLVNNKLCIPLMVYKTGIASLLLTIYYSVSTYISKESREL